MSFVLAITGPSGVGKSTVATRLAKQLEKCVNIEADHVKHFIVSGFYQETASDGTKKWKFNQWELVGDSIGLLARNFLDAGYDVIISGYIDEPAWPKVQKHVTLTHKVLLLPKVDIAVQRDGGREGDIAMGEEMVREHHQEFSSSIFYRDFVRLDTTDQTVDETVGKIQELLAS
jgi:ribose 1,5-bisphosphokinase PhnN